MAKKINIYDNKMQLALDKMDSDDKSKLYASVFDSVYASMDILEKREIDRIIKRLMVMRGVGEDSAKQIVVVLGIATHKRLNFVESKRNSTQGK